MKPRIAELVPGAPNGEESDGRFLPHIRKTKGGIDPFRFDV